MQTFSFICSYRSFSSLAAFLAFRASFFSYLSALRFDLVHSLSRFALFIELSFESFCSFLLFVFGYSFWKCGAEGWILVRRRLGFPLFPFYENVVHSIGQYLICEHLERRLSLLSTSLSNTRFSYWFLSLWVRKSRWNFRRVTCKALQNKKGAVDGPGVGSGPIDLVSKHVLPLFLMNNHHNLVRTAVPFLGPIDFLSDSGRSHILRQWTMNNQHCLVIVCCPSSYEQYTMLETIQATVHSESPQ